MLQVYGDCIDEWREASLMKSKITLIFRMIPENLCNEVDPSMLLLQDTTKSFHGNYSCKGKNYAGWGNESAKTELIVNCK